MLKTDVVVIGAGAVGCAVARELSKYEVDVIVVEKNEDVGGDASKSNSGLFSTSATMPVGTLECRLRTPCRVLTSAASLQLSEPILTA